MKITCLIFFKLKVTPLFYDIWGFQLSFISILPGIDDLNIWMQDSGFILNVSLVGYQKFPT